MQCSKRTQKHDFETKPHAHARTHTLDTPRRAMRDTRAAVRETVAADDGEVTGTFMYGFVHPLNGSKSEKEGEPS